MSLLVFHFVRHIVDFLGEIHDLPACLFVGRFVYGAHDDISEERVYTVLMDLDNLQYSLKLKVKWRTANTVA